MVQLAWLNFNQKFPKQLNTDQIFLHELKKSPHLLNGYQLLTGKYQTFFLSIELSDWRKGRRDWKRRWTKIKQSFK